MSRYMEHFGKTLLLTTANRIGKGSGWDHLSFRENFSKVNNKMYTLPKASKKYFFTSLVQYLQKQRSHSLTDAITHYELSYSTFHLPGAGILYTDSLGVK